MRKLKLNIQHLGNVEILTREQLKKVMGGEPASTGSHSCCIRANLADGYNPYPMYFTPQVVSSQAACQALADNIAMSKDYTNVHYDTDCDGK